MGPGTHYMQHNVIQPHYMIGNTFTKASRLPDSSGYSWGIVRFEINVCVRAFRVQTCSDVTREALGRLPNIKETPVKPCGL